MPVRSGPDGYGGVAKALHWLTVLALVAQFTVGYALDVDDSVAAGGADAVAAASPDAAAAEVATTARCSRTPARCSRCTCSWARSS